MGAAKTDGDKDWSTQLTKKFLGRRDPRQKRGRPKVLHTGKVSDPNERALGNLLRDIAEASEKIAAKNPRLQSRTDIARQLWQQPKHKLRGFRTLRRDVSTAIGWQINQLERTPPELWPKLFGVQPPATTTKRAILDKSLEALRVALARSPESAGQ
jgi:hypothetical protein